MFDFISEILIEKKDTIMTYGQQLRQEGMQQGMQQGIQQGMQAKSLEIASHMLQQLHLGIDVVAKATGLGKEELGRIQQQARQRG